MSQRNSAESNGLNDPVGGLSQKEKQAKKAWMTSFEYKMDHKYRGLAIIFNHYKYKDPSIQLRDGTEKDVDALLESLPLLGFERDNIIVANDLKEKEIFNYIDHMRASKSDVLNNCDCIAVFILSLGSENNEIYASDGMYDLFKLVEQYTAKNFKELAGKPKLFFVNAARGSRIHKETAVRLRQRKSNIVGDSNTKTVSQEQRESNVVDNSIVLTSDQLYTYPIHADILISFSSYRGHISFRDTKTGSCYIQNLCETIKQFNTQNKLATSDINELLLHTHLMVSKPEASSFMQTPIFNSAMCQKLYFRPKPNKLS